MFQQFHENIFSKILVLRDAKRHESSKGQLICLFLFFIHLKPKLLTQFPASNDQKYLFIWKRDITKFELFNPLSPHDAFKHHFTSLKTGLIFL